MFMTTSDLNTIFDLYYGTLLDTDALDSAIGGVFPNLLSDVCLKIFEAFDEHDHLKCSLVCKNWNLLTHHFFAERRAELYKGLFNPRDWNKAHPDFQIPNEEMTEAFRMLPANLDLSFYSVCCRPKGLSLTLFGNLLKRHYPDNINGYYQITVSEDYSEKKTKKFAWIILGQLGRESVCVDDTIITSHHLIKNDLSRSTSLEYYKDPSVLDVACLLTAQKIKFKIELFPPTVPAVHCKKEKKSDSYVPEVRISKEGIDIFSWSYVFSGKFIMQLKKFKNHDVSNHS